MNIKLFLTSAIMLIVNCLLAQTTTLTENMHHPESVISDGKFLYVSNVGEKLAPSERDGDGSISKLTLDGKVADAHFNKAPLNAPKGMGIIGSDLYVSDIDHIIVIDLATGNKKDEIDLSEYKTVFLNDITIKDKQTLFVSSTDLGKVFSVSLQKPYQTKALDLPPLKGPNGLLYNGKTNMLYIVGFVWGDVAAGEIGAITWKGDKCSYERLVDNLGYFDGVQLQDDNTLLVSDWVSLKEMKADLLKIDLKKKTSEVLLKGADAADILYDGARKRLLFPGLTSGKLTSYSIK